MSLDLCLVPNHAMVIYLFCLVISVIYLHHKSVYIFTFLSTFGLTVNYGRFFFHQAEGDVWLFFKMHDLMIFYKRCRSALSRATHGYVCVRGQFGESGGAEKIVAEHTKESTSG